MPRRKEISRGLESAPGRCYAPVARRNGGELCWRATRQGIPEPGGDGFASGEAPKPPQPPSTIRHCPFMPQKTPAPRAERTARWLTPAKVARISGRMWPYFPEPARNWTIARFKSVEGKPTITLFEAIARYIWNGGIDWRSGWKLNVVGFGTFMLALSYNVLRGVLLWKTKKLELAQEASGLPVRFSLAGGWRNAFLVAKWGLYANLGVVAVHSWHFLMQRIPL